jgi:ribosomal protein S18 acetylase RimI-like enzyme
MQIRPLRQFSANSLSPLLLEETEAWARFLRWDFRPVLEILTRLLDSSALPGFAAIEQGRPVGYAYYWEQKGQGLIGGCFVSQPSSGHGYEEALLTGVIEALQSHSLNQRIEAQFISFHSWGADPFFLSRDFRIFPRYFMIREDMTSAVQDAPEGIELIPWNSGHLEAAACLTRKAYVGLADNKVSAHYQSDAGCREFLSNIILRPGCGAFLSDASFSAWDSNTGDMAGFVLASMVSPRNGHIPQITVAKTFQGKGLGKSMLNRTIESLARRNYQSVSLSVTASNERAVSLYRHNRFQILKPFQAYVWERLP